VDLDNPVVSRRVAGLGTAAAVAVLLLGAWFVPVVAVIAVWPLLFLVPGAVIIAAVRPRIDAPGRVGLAIVLSVAISAHLVYWLSIVLGDYSRVSVFIVAAVLAAPLPVAAWYGGTDIFRRTGFEAGRALRRNKAAFAFAAVSALFVGLVLHLGLWVETGTGVAAGGSNWSDLGVHLSIAQSLNAGNFPPQVPYFAGVPLTYHWFSDFHAAIAAKSADIFAVPAFVVSSAILTGALALLVYGLAHRLVRSQRARRVAILAAVLVIFGGGLGWIRWAGDIFNGAGDPLHLMFKESYDNSWYDINNQVTWPYFRIPSVMGTGLLVHRATVAGLPILVGAILLLVAGLPSARARARGMVDRPALIFLAGLLGALLAPFHFFFFPGFWLIALIYVVAARRLTDSNAPRNAALLLAPLILAVPFAVAPFLQATGSQALKVVSGWESAPWSDGAPAVVFFYLTNLGIPFVLACAALFARRTPWRVFLGAWAVALFIIPNVIQVSVIAFDMNKYFQAMWVAVAILAAWLMRRWPRPIISGIVALSMLSPLLVAGWTAGNREQIMDNNSVAAADWIALNTPPRAVFATDGWLNSPTDAAGRLRLSTYGPYVANLGYDPDVRAQQVHDIYCANDDQVTTSLMTELGASYLLDIGRPDLCDTPTDFTTVPELQQVYENPGVRIYRLTSAAAAASNPAPPAP